MTLRDDCTNKLAEAQHYLDEMRAHQNNPQVFVWRLSAFLSAVRSPLQYIHRDENVRPWYVTRVSANKLIGFFNQERNLNIHEIPVQPRRNAEAQFVVAVGSSVSLGLVVTRAATGETEVLDVQPDGNLQQAVPEEQEQAIRWNYEFADWKGRDKDVSKLSASCLAEVRQVVNDGIQAGQF